MASRETMEFPQAISGPKHAARHISDPVFGLGLDIGDISNIPVSWTDSHLVQAGIRAFLPFHQGSEQPKLVRTRSLLSSLGFKLDLGEQATRHKAQVSMI